MSFLTERSRLTPSALSCFTLRAESCAQNRAHAGWGVIPTTQAGRLRPTEEQGAAQGHGAMGSPKRRTLAWPLHAAQLLPAPKAWTVWEWGRGHGAGRRGGGLRREEEEPSQGTGRACWGRGRIISQSQGLALSPLRLKKHLIRLQGLETWSQGSLGPPSPFCITATGSGRGWAPRQPPPSPALLSAGVPRQGDKTVREGTLHRLTNSTPFLTTSDGARNQGRKNPKPLEPHQRVPDQLEEAPATGPSEQQ